MATISRIIATFVCLHRFLPPIPSLSYDSVAPGEAPCAFPAPGSYRHIYRRSRSSVDTSAAHLHRPFSRIPSASPIPLKTTREASMALGVSERFDRGHRRTHNLVIGRSYFPSMACAERVNQERTAPTARLTGPLGPIKVLFGLFMASERSRSAQ